MVDFKVVILILLLVIIINRLLKDAFQTTRKYNLPNKEIKAANKIMYTRCREN